MDLKESDSERVLEQVDLMRDDVVALGQALIRFDSVNQPPGGNEGPCQAFVAERMVGLGLQVDTFQPDQVAGINQDPAYLRGRDYDGRPNVVGTLVGMGGGLSLHLAVHADVVPIAKPERREVNPFGADLIDGQIWGRGAVDDKSELASVLAALEPLHWAGVRLGGDLILSSYMDEEFGGGNGLLSIVRKGYLGDAAINCDGLAFTRWVATTGGGPFRVLIQSRAQASHPTPAMRRLASAPATVRHWPCVGLVSTRQAASSLLETQPKSWSSR